jgi:hypothetical protein
LKSDILLFADDQVILADSEDEFHCSLYNLQYTAKGFNMEISTEKAKIVLFKENIPLTAIFVYTLKLLNKSLFKYHGGGGGGYYVTNENENEKDVAVNITNFN